MTFCVISPATTQTLTVSVFPKTLTVYPGQTQVPITVSVAGPTTSGAINVTLTQLPAGISVEHPVTVPAGGSGTLFLDVDPSAAYDLFSAGSPSDSNSVAIQTSVVAASGATTATTGFGLTVSLSNQEFVPGTFTLPILRINTSGTPVTSNDISVAGTVVITSADGQISYLPSSSNADNTAILHVHGNTTALMPKVPYTLKFNASLDLLTSLGVQCPYVTSSGKPVCGKSKSYILLANYDDKTLLRDWSASSLANSIPYSGSYLAETVLPASSTGAIPTPSGNATLLPWAPHSAFVEVFMNGGYEGVYQLVEKPNVDSHRVNISELSETNTSSDVTGGYLLEIDEHKDEAFVFTTPQGLPIGLLDPDFSPDTEVPEQTKYISEYVSAAETALFSKAFADPSTGWRAYFDEATAINYYLINEIMGNVDGGDFYSSVYMYKAKDNPMLYMGPVWDFDISAGNVNYEPIVNPTVPWVQTSAKWYTRWFNDPGFKADVVKQFNTLKSNGLLAAWMRSIVNQASSLKQAQSNNFSRWPILGVRVWPNAEAAGSYDGEVAYLLNYLDLRVAYLDSLFNGKAQTSTVLSGPSSFSVGTAQTFVAHVVASGSIAGNVTFLQNDIVLGTGAIDRAGSASLTMSQLHLGTYSITAVYSGDNNNALSSSSALPVTIVAAPIPTVTNLAVASSATSVGNSVSMSVSVVAASGVAQPTGTVSFVDNGLVLGTAAISNGTAMFSTTALPVGTAAVQAIYSGDVEFSESSSNLISVTVSPLGTSDVNAGSGFSSGLMVLNGSAALSGTRLRLTDGQLYERSSAFLSTAVNVQAFTSDFTFQLTQPGADGIMFVVQNQGLRALGDFGQDLGYGGIAASAGVKFDLYDNAGEGKNSTGFYTGGVRPTTSSIDLTTSGVDLHSGNVMQANVKYDGKVLTVVLMDTVTKATATQTYLVDLPSVVGGNTAYIGFTGGTGGAAATQDVLTWTYAPQTPLLPEEPDVNDGSGFSSSLIALNGSAVLSGSRLRLTDGQLYERSSAFSSTAVNVQAFTSDFTFQLTNPGADGIMFVLQNQGRGALGDFGQDLGYGGIAASAGVKFDLYDNAGEGKNSTGLYSGGVRPTTSSIDLTPSGVDLHSGDVMQAHLEYDGKVLTVVLTDTVTKAKATQTYQVDLPSVVGGDTAYIGFTGGTGGAAATQDILTWTYTAQTPLSTAAPGVSAGSGFPSGLLVLNGSAALSGSRLRLTDGQLYERSSAFSSTAVNVQAFMSDFTFQLTNPGADGIMFVLQNQGRGALGAFGQDLGYGGIAASAGVKFDLYDNAGEGKNSTGFYSGGVQPTTSSIDLTPSGVNLHSGNVMLAHLNYDGEVLTVVLTDTVTKATATQTYQVDLPSVVGGDTAYIGFTGGTGGAAATQDILTWTYTPGL